MKRMGLAFAVLLAACATPSATADFRGEYTRTRTITMMNGEPPGEGTDVIEIGPTRDGRARIEINLIFTNAHTCWLEGRAAVNATGLLFESLAPENDGPFRLAIDISGDQAKLRVIEGTGSHYCGMRGHWGDDTPFVKQ